MNNDLISRSALLEKYQGRGFIFESIVRLSIEEAPAIDAEPVRHGEWIPIMLQDVFGKEFVSHHKCSVCEGDALYECANYDAEEELSNFCPNCGAKMDACPNW